MSKIRTIVRGGALAIGATLILTGCGDGGKSAPESAANAEGECTAERVGGTVTMAMGAQPSGLDPLSINGTPSTGGMELAQIYDTLMSYDAENKSYEPRVAQSLDHNAEYDEWTLGLRPDVVFGNGDPLTAEAVKFSLERFQSDKNKGTYRNLALEISEMEVVDSTTLVIRLKRPWATFPFALANTPGMIVNTKIVDERGDGFVTNPAGAGVGAYEPTEYAPGEKIVLTAKKDYWAGPVCVEEIRFVPMATDSNKYDSFRSGEVEAAWLRQPSTIDETDKDDVAGFKTFQNAANVLLLNSGVRDSNPPTKDVNIRRAISYAIDVDAIDQRQNKGTGAPTTSILGEESGFANAATGPQHDQAKAVALVEQAKRDGYDGKLRLVSAMANQESGLAVEAYLRAAGFDVSLETLPDTAAIVDRVIIKADYDVAFFGMNLIDEGLWATVTNSLSSTSKSNYGGLQDPATDAVLDELRVAGTPDEISAAMEDLQEAWNASVPAVILNASPNKTIHVDNLHNLHPTSNSLVFFADAYLS